MTAVAHRRGGSRDGNAHFQTFGLANPSAKGSRAAALKRVRDQGLLELDCARRHEMPVSRSRLPRFRAVLGI